MSTNSFDYSILSWLNQFVGQHPSFDGAVVSLSNNGFLRGGVLAGLCCWAWFQHGEGENKNRAARETIISGMLTCLASIVLTRLVIMMLPFRVRPLCDPANGLHFPAATTDWEHWSAFPSDHAIMFFALTTCLFFVSRAMGWIALLDTVFLVCLPRLYLGIHYPTDLLAGAAIGVGMGCLAQKPAIKGFLAKGALRWQEKYPGPFYAAAFLFLYQLTVIFWDVRSLVLPLIRRILKH